MKNLTPHPTARDSAPVIGGILSFHQNHKNTTPLKAPKITFWLLSLLYRIDTHYYSKESEVSFVKVTLRSSNSTKMPTAEGRAQTLYDKVFQDHIIDERLDGTILLYIGMQ